MDCSFRRRPEHERALERTDRRTPAPIGQFVYQDLDHGHEVGQSRLTISRLTVPERYEFSANITGDADQRWTAIASRSFDPISATFVVHRTRRSVDTVGASGDR